MVQISATVVAAFRLIEEKRLMRTHLSLSIVIMLIAYSAGVQARNPTAADTAFCQRYALTMQKALDTQRSGDPVAIRSFRQEVIKDPQADLMMRGLGVTQVTPPWVTNVVDVSMRHCIDEVLNDMRGYLPGDSEVERPMNTPANHVGTITRLPSR